VVSCRSLFQTYDKMQMASSVANTQQKNPPTQYEAERYLGVLHRGEESLFGGFLDSFVA